ncbi:F-box domain protein [Aspergillus sclerotiicarbonarius CBS 121057]|uniref:F-box domain protein n=1 Tax=Aspergillus sclerotiicarbonarius (strain CBS 121057 / IBT 28362) TaxID=1448318 RepID=A0A319ED42_ASPSB|nr:F-box domain protein [Aspergillus sclerotiicarbonarius CBS 121057]
MQPALGERNQGPAEMVDDPQASLLSPGEIGAPFLELPPELVQQILSYLSAQDLARLSTTCRTFAEHATNELLWMNIINSHLPEPIHDPGVFDSFRGLYIAHHPCWFVPRNKVWFSDTEHTGNLILARYDHRRGVIEAYRVIAERRSHQFQIWDWNPDVVIQSFNPKVSLWLDDPVLLLKKHNEGQPRYLRGETRMPMPIETQHVFNTFSLCSPGLPADLKANKQWPPTNIPSKHRVYRDVELELPEWERHPRQLDNVSEHAFRIRRWAHFRLGMPMFTAGRSETLSTYATLDPDLYTPTKEKPYQGIWVGDYSAHGCEFLLFLQRERADEHASDSGEESIPQCSLEAVKLTGDPNVPRGEISFSADDTGPGGLVRIAEEALFQGARIVRSRGHVAGLGFRDDTFIESQLILISTECVAHYWETMGHISYYRRLDIDALIRT